MGVITVTVETPLSTGVLPAFIFCVRFAQWDINGAAALKATT